MCSSGTFLTAHTPQMSFFLGLTAGALKSCLWLGPDQKLCDSSSSCSLPTLCCIGFSLRSRNMACSRHKQGHRHNRQSGIVVRVHLRIHSPLAQHELQTPGNRRSTTGTCALMTHMLHVCTTTVSPDSPADTPRVLTALPFMASLLPCHCQQALGGLDTSVAVCFTAEYVVMCRAT